MKSKEKQIHVRLSEEIHKKLRIKCAYEDSSIQEYVAQLIAEDLQRTSGKQKEK